MTEPFLDRVRQNLGFWFHCSPNPLITQMSPAAWRHILLNGHYTFQTDGKFIDLDALVAGLELG